jgi:hypothetical protein
MAAHNSHPHHGRADGLIRKSDCSTANTAIIGQFPASFLTNALGRPWLRSLSVGPDSKRQPELAHPSALRAFRELQQRGSFRGPQSGRILFWQARSGRFLSV